MEAPKAGWPLVSAVVGGGHVLGLSFGGGGGGLLLRPRGTLRLGRALRTLTAPHAHAHQPLVPLAGRDGLEPGLEPSALPDSRRVASEKSVKATSTNWQGQRPRCWALPRSLSACLRKRRENGQVSAWPR